MKNIYLICCIALSLLCTTATTAAAVSKVTILNYVKTTEAKYHIPKNLLYAIIKQESDFKINARLDNSHGLGQVTEQTARFFCKINKKRLYAYKDNIKCSASYLKYQLNRYNNNAYLAISAYNTGTPYICNGTNYIRKLNKKTITVLTKKGVTYRCKEKGKVSNKKYVKNVMKFWKSKSS